MWALFERTQGLLQQAVSVDLISRQLMNLTAIVNAVLIDCCRENGYKLHQLHPAVAFEGPTHFVHLRSLIFTSMNPKNMSSY